MRLLRLSWVNYKRMIKEFGNWLMMFLLPMGMITIVLFTQGNTKPLDSNEAAFIIEDKGDYGSAMVDDLGILDHIYRDENDKAMKLLEDKEVSAVYVIPNDFSEIIKKGEKPKLDLYVYKEGNSPIITEAAITQWVETKLYEEVLIKEGIITEAPELIDLRVEAIPQSNNNYVNVKLRIVMILIIFYIIFDSVEVANQIVKLKKDKILLRAATTSNRWSEITGSIYIALFWLQVTIFSLMFLFALVIGNIQVESLSIMLISIVLAVCISLSLGFLLMRLFKRAELITMTAVMLNIVMFYISVMGSGNDANQGSWIIQNIAKFMPIYWLLDMINHLRLLPNIPILLLMAIAMFTAGNIKGSKKELIS